ncbi:MAG: type II toxin-antitoxin system RelE/ParE family toxin [Elusimicrobia bacterium]|nr:type II toxin-antitoxin system RelE/ParE family toxin [Elusimicrobiota bacterium]
MIVGFADCATEDVWNGENTSAARRVPKTVWPAAQRKLDMIDAADSLNDLRIPPGNRLEKLSGRLDGHFSIRINDQWRVVFRWGGRDADGVSIVDYH